jgi:AraC-like DNA-binding protein
MPKVRKHPPLLARFPFVDSRNLDEVRAITGKLWSRHEVTVQGGDRFQTLINSFQKGGISLSYVDCPTRLRIHCGPVEQHFGVHLHLYGKAIHTINTTVETASPWRAVIHSPGQELLMEPGPTRALVLAFNQGLVEKELEKRGIPLAIPHTWMTGFSTEVGAGRALKSLALWLARELDQADSPLIRPEVFCNLESSLLGLFMEVLEGLIAQKGKGNGPVADDLSALEKWLADNLGKNLRLEDLAAQAGLTPRSIQLAFQRLRGLTPGQCIRNLRLDKARELLKRNPGLSVREVAESVGIPHVARFSRYFEERFGVSPQMAKTKKGQIRKQK